MRRTGYQRGFVAGELVAVKFIARQLATFAPDVGDVRKLVESLGPVIGVAGIVAKAVGGQDIPADDYDEWAEGELRDERFRIEYAIESAAWFGVRGARDEDSDQLAAARALQRVPEGLRDGLQLYLDEHIQPGHFLTAVLQNDMKEAMGRADLRSRVGLFDIIGYLYNHAPAPAWGGKKQVELWLTPTIPTLEVKEVGPELAYVDGGKTACPGCGGFHLVHHFTAEPGRVAIPDDGHTKLAHEVQFVYCRQVHLHVVGVEGREIAR